MQTTPASFVANLLNLLQLYAVVEMFMTSVFKLNSQKTLSTELLPQKSTHINLISLSKVYTSVEVVQGESFTN